jgi:hypothetical protein
MGGATVALAAVVGLAILAGARRAGRPAEEPYPAADRKSAGAVANVAEAAFILGDLDCSARKNLSPTANDIKRQAGREAFQADVQAVAGRECVLLLRVEGVNAQWITLEPLSEVSAQDRRGHVQVVRRHHRGCGAHGSSNVTIEC